jgi:uncharacterized protein YbaR (Trm112 family)
MALDRKLLDILCCPVTHAELEPAPRSLLHMLNLRIEQGKLQTRGGAQAQEAWPDALVTRDGRLAYPVRDDVPILLESEAVIVAQLDGQG